MPLLVNPADPKIAGCAAEQRGAKLESVCLITGLTFQPELGLLLWCSCACDNTISNMRYRGKGTAHHIGS